MRWDARPPIIHTPMRRAIKNPGLLGRGGWGGCGLGCGCKRFYDKSWQGLHFQFNCRLYFPFAIPLGFFSRREIHNDFTRARRPVITDGDGKFSHVSGSFFPGSRWGRDYPGPGTRPGLWGWGGITCGGWYRPDLPHTQLANDHHTTPIHHDKM